jgi:hypothetical protein
MSSAFLWTSIQLRHNGSFQFSKKKKQQANTKIFSETVSHRLTARDSERSEDFMTQRRTSDPGTYVPGTAELFAWCR